MKYILAEDEHFECIFKFDATPARFMRKLGEVFEQSRRAAFLGIRARFLKHIFGRPEENAMYRFGCGILGELPLVIHPQCFFVRPPQRIRYRKNVSTLFPPGLS